MLDHIRIVLVNTSHPGNIGSSARAMKTMGLSHLYLVTPGDFPHQKAYEMASGAGDILDQAQVCNDLLTAIGDCTLVIGTSTRARTIPWPIFSARDMGIKLSQEDKRGKVAILFGCEQSGLSNEELQHCHMHVQIPANPDYSSLNLSAAVQVIAYELRMAHDQSTLITEWDYRLANSDEMEKFFVHLQETLINIEFLKLNAPRKLMTRLRRFFFRARPDVMEVNILRGMLTAIQESTRSKQ